MIPIVVTGGAGFIGLNLIEHMVRQSPYEIRIIDNLSNSNPGRIEAALRRSGRVQIEPNGVLGVTTPAGTSRVILRVADILDAGVAAEICTGAHAVIHLAGQTGVPTSLENARRDMEANIIGTFNYLEACRQRHITRFIMASSASVLGNATPPQIEDKPNRPTSPYGASKGAAEGYCSAYFHSFGIRTSALRFSNVYGPLSWSKGSVVASFCKSILGNRPMTIFGNGKQTRDFLHVGDLVAVAYRFLHQPKAGLVDPLDGTPVNIATGIRTRVLEMARALQEVAGRRGHPCKIEFEPARTGDVMISAPDPGLLHRKLPDTSFRKLDAGLEETFDWFLKSWPEPAVSL